MPVLEGEGLEGCVGQDVRDPQCDGGPATLVEALAGNSQPDDDVDVGGADVCPRTGRERAGQVSGS
jgi:hypothetical protein